MWRYWGRGGQPGSTYYPLLTTGSLWKSLSGSFQSGKKYRKQLAVGMIGLRLRIFRLSSDLGQCVCGCGSSIQRNFKFQTFFQRLGQIQRQRLLGVVWWVTEILWFLASWRGNKVRQTTGRLSLHSQTDWGGAGRWEEYLQSDQTMDLSPQSPSEWGPG